MLDFEHRTPYTSLAIVHLFWLLLASAILLISGLPVHAQQDQTDTDSTLPDTEILPGSVELGSLSEKLMELSAALDAKRIQREELTKQIADVGDDQVSREELVQSLEEVNKDVALMRATFELIALDRLDLESMQDEEAAYDWRDELVQIVAPVLESLKSITEKPRAVTELKETIRVAQDRVTLAEDAVSTIEQLRSAGVDEATSEKLNGLLSKWSTERESQGQKLLVARSRLQRIESTENPLFVEVWPTIRNFIAGRGLTLLLAGLAALVVWFVLRFVWWIVNKRLVSRKVRRGNLWYRLAAYSSYLITILMMIVAVIIVLYLRQDLLLLALALVVLAVTAIGLRTFLPRYLREARLLLNIGPVREDERVMYNGLPWQVMSLNIETVLRNPALDGVLRLPLGTIEGLTSRPVKDNTWFPTEPGDRIFLPDGGFATVENQTPELVTLKVRGGMTKTCPSSDFYSMQVVNISGGDTFGVAVTFGLDYSLQSIALSEIPQKFKDAIVSAAQEAGVDKNLTDVMVELNEAGPSSLDYLIYLTVDSEIAGSYYALKRLVLQACLAESNKNGWNIPFPQMTVHHQPVFDG